VSSAETVRRAALRRQWRGPGHDRPAAAVVHINLAPGSSEGEPAILPIDCVGLLDSSGRSRGTKETIQHDSGFAAPEEAPSAGSGTDAPIGSAVRNPTAWPYVDPKMTMPSAFRYQLFVDALRKNAWIFDNDAETDERRLDTALAMLQGVVLYLMGDEEIAEQHLARPLGWLENAINDFRRGAIPDALKPATPVSGRPTRLAREDVRQKDRPTKRQTLSPVSPAIFCGPKGETR
jgi:hypothetical protein